MADEKPTETEGNAPQQPPRVQVLNQYIRDLSFENLAMQKGQVPEGQTAFAVQISLDAKKIGDNHYEVINKLKVTAKVVEEEIFILELDYAGRFNIENVPDEQLHPFLMVECPRMIFPYLRRVVGDITRDGGYPPLNLDNIDFVALYRNELTRRAEAQAKDATIT